MKKISKSAHPLAYWLNIITAMLLIPLLAVITLNYILSRKVLVDRASDVNRNMLELYMNEIDQKMDRASVFINTMIGSNENIIFLQTETDPNKRMLIKRQLYQDIVYAALNHYDMGGFFVYSQSDDEDYFVSYTGLENYEQGYLAPDSLEEYFRKLADTDSISIQGWQLFEIREEWYLYRCAKQWDIYIGTWIPVERLVDPLEKIHLGADGFSVVIQKDGKVLTGTRQDITIPEGLTGSGDVVDAGGLRFLHVSIPSKKSPVYLAVMIPLKVIMEDSRYILFSIIGFILLSLVLFAVVEGLIRFGLYRPIRSMHETIETIRQGDMDVRMNGGSRLLELHNLSRHFNDMMDEIQNLKIRMYEEQLREKETYLQYLQLQIHPHFFLNCMSLIHNMASLKKYEEIKKLSQHMIRYFRYMMRKANSLITVQEEMSHVGDYMEIQMMRFPDGICYRTEIDHSLDEALLPPLSIQTFVENSIKYALDLTSVTEITVTVRKLGSGTMNVTVSDNGKGYPVEVLSEINKKEGVFAEEETHRIGIRNVKERLNLIFGEEYYINFYNDQGSVSEFVIPVILSPEEKEQFQFREEPACIPY